MGDYIGPSLVNPGSKTRKNQWTVSEISKDGRTTYGPRTDGQGRLLRTPSGEPGVQNDISYPFSKACKYIIWSLFIKLLETHNYNFKTQKLIPKCISNNLKFPGWTIYHSKKLIELSTTNISCDDCFSWG